MYLNIKMQKGASWQQEERIKPAIKTPTITTELR